MSPEISMTLVQRTVSLEPSQLATDNALRGDSHNLDALRSLAVLFVLLAHLPALRTLTAGKWPIQALGPLGVVIFFVHTCLVLMFSLERQTRDFGTARLARIFLIRRAFRIYPLSIVTVILMATIARPLAEAAITWPTVVSNLFLIQNLTGTPSLPGPLWSLPYEVQMYLLLPALFVLVGRNPQRAPLLLGALWTLSIAITLIAWISGLNYHLVKYFPCFIPGVLAFALRPTRRTYSSWVLFAYVGLVALAVPFGAAAGMREMVAMWPVCLGLGMLIPYCRDFGHPALRRAAKTLATYSYGIYLFHVPCITLAFEQLDSLPPAMQWLLFGTILSGLSYLAFHFIEKPGMALGRRMIMDLAARRPSTSRA